MSQIYGNFPNLNSGFSVISGVQKREVYFLKKKTFFVIQKKTAEEQMS